MKVGEIYRNFEQQTFDTFWNFSPVDRVVCCCRNRLRQVAVTSWTTNRNSILVAAKANYACKQNWKRNAIYSFSGCAPGFADWEQNEAQWLIHYNLLIPSLRQWETLRIAKWRHAPVRPELGLDRQTWKMDTRIYVRVSQMRGTTCTVVLCQKLHPRHKQTSRQNDNRTCPLCLFVFLCLSFCLMSICFSLRWSLTLNVFGASKSKPLSEWSLNLIKNYSPG